MPQYVVTITEMVSQAFRVEAASAVEAAELARNRWRAGEYVLEPGDLVDVEFCAHPCE